MDSKTFRSGVGYLIGLYILLVTTYYLSSQLLVYHCTPWGWVGWFRSAFLVESLECRALKWLFTYTYDHIRNLWTLLSAWLINHVIRFFADLFSG